VSDTQNNLRLNVGFIINQSKGYMREFPLEFPFIHIPPDLDLTNLSGSARVTRTGKGLLVQVKMHAQTMNECVRCLQGIPLPLDIEFTELYAFSADSSTDSELILPESGQIDLRPLVREEMLLAVPINPLCDPECKGLCPICGENRNETECDHDIEVIDPRLSVLKSLLNEEG
jgi:uncharacterized protein